EALIHLTSQPEAGVPAQATAAACDNALLRGALVLLCSHIEGFFEDLISDALTAYGVLAEKAVQFPVQIRAYQVAGKAARWSTPDHVARWALIQESIGHPLAFDDNEEIASALDPDLHTRGFANPGTAEIDDLFRTIGIAEVWTIFSVKEP